MGRTKIAPILPRPLFRRSKISSSNPLSPQWGERVRVRGGKIILCLGMIFLLLGPAVLGAATDPAGITVTRADCGRQIVLGVGDILKVELPSHGGTGYQWSLTAPGAPYLKLLAQTSQNVGAVRPGSPLRQIWSFQAVRPGSTVIRLAYFRPWEGVDRAAERFHLKIKINQDR
jgi:predicted secreted protein